LAIWLCLACVAPAQAGPREEGYALYKQGAYDRALKKFLRAYRQLKNPDLLYNVAKCHEKLSQYEEAIRFYKEYLAKKPGASDRKDVEQIIASLTYRLEATYPEVEFVSSPPGANVRVDGEFAGQAPFKMQLRPGQHQAKFELDGHRPTERTFDVRSGKKLRLALLMKRADGGGSLKVLSNVDNARILVDEQLIGVTPQASARGVSPGRHRVRVEKDGYTAWQGEVEVSEGRERMVFASLRAVKRGWSKKAIIATSTRAPTISSATAISPQACTWARACSPRPARPCSPGPCSSPRPRQRPRKSPGPGAR
jgi:hypothetical protein